MSNPDAIASEIAERFPEDAKDLKLVREKKAFAVPPPSMFMMTRSSGMQP
jgi:hypothetical protein